MSASMQSPRIIHWILAKPFVIPPPICICSDVTAQHRTRQLRRPNTRIICPYIRFLRGGPRTTGRRQSFMLIFRWRSPSKVKVRRGVNARSSNVRWKLGRETTAAFRLTPHLKARLSLSRYSECGTTYCGLGDLRQIGYWQAKYALTTDAEQFKHVLLPWLMPCPYFWHLVLEFLRVFVRFREISIDPQIRNSQALCCQRSSALPSEMIPFLGPKRIYLQQIINFSSSIYASNV